MTQDDIISWAREAGFEKVVAIHPDGSKTVTVAPIPELERFANLVAAAELREALAQRKPLTDEEIQVIWDVAAAVIPGWSRHIAYARAIEAAHNIGGAKP